MLRAKALYSVAGAHSLVKLSRARSAIKGTESAANFSLAGIGGAEGGGGAAFASVDAGGDWDGAGAASLLADDETFGPPSNSIFVKYKKPPTPMATSDTTVTTSGHIQCGAAWARTGGGFFTCGVG